MKTRTKALISVLFFFTQTGAGTTNSENFAIKHETFDIPAFTIDRPYPSMKGPIKEANVTLKTTSTKIWVKDFRVELVDKHANRVSLEYLCHAWAWFPGGTTASSGNLLTISQGMEEMAFPKGFGLEIAKPKQSIALLAQVLNNNEEVRISFDARFTLGYIESSSAESLNLKPLFQTTVAVLHPGEEHEHDHADHFKVPHGLHIYRTTINRKSSFYRSARIHYIKMHLHPYGESMALFDKTTNQTIWRGQAVNSRTRAVLLKTDHFSSSDGLQIFPDHEYELVAMYNNTTSHPIDAMAVFRIYFGQQR